MKIRIYSTSDLHGGAARAAYRLFEGTSVLYPDQEIIVFNKVTDDPAVRKAPGRLTGVLSKFSYGIDQLPLRWYRQRNRNAPWSTNWLPYPGVVSDRGADVMHFHWVGNGMAPISQIGHIRAPIVWTMHDEWAYTGGCHLTLGCQRFEKACGICPQLGSHRERDLSRSIWKKKQRAWRHARIIPVTPSRWLGARAASSSLLGNLDIRVIPNGLDLSIYRPIDKQLARQLLRLPTDGRFILFGAVKSTAVAHKGFSKLIAALEKLGATQQRQELSLLIFGASHNASTDALPIPTHYVGTLHDDLMLALLYSAADVFVAPSQQENLPNTIMESLACGTPAVAFRVGGISDLIEHEANGYLAAPADADDLARGISWVLADDERWRRLSARARQKCEQEFEISQIARRYADLYEEVASQA